MIAKLVRHFWDTFATLHMDSLSATFTYSFKNISSETIHSYRLLILKALKYMAKKETFWNNKYAYVINKWIPNTCSFMIYYKIEVQNNIHNTGLRWNNCLELNCVSKIILHANYLKKKTKKFYELQLHQNSVLFILC